MTVFYMTEGKAGAIRSANRPCFPLNNNLPCHSERQRGIPLTYFDILIYFHFIYYSFQILKILINYLMTFYYSSKLTVM